MLFWDQKQLILFMRHCFGMPSGLEIDKFTFIRTQLDEAGWWKFIGVFLFCLSYESNIILGFVLGV